MQAAQAFSGHMGVDLGGADVGMAEHRLHRTQIRTMAQQMGRKGMAQCVRRYMFVDSNLLGVMPKAHPEVLSRHCIATFA